MMGHLYLDLLVDIDITLGLAVLAEDDMLQVGTDGVNAALVDIFIFGCQSNYVQKCLPLYNDLVDLTTNQATQFMRRNSLFLLRFFLVPDLN